MTTDHLTDVVDGAATASIPGPFLFEAVRARAASAPNQPVFSFITDSGETARLDARTLDARCRQLAARLQRIAVPGARVLIATPPGLDFVVAVLGTLYAGAVAVPVAANPGGRLRRAADRLASIVPEAGISVAIAATADDAEQIAGAARAAFAPVSWISLDSADDTSAGAWTPPRPAAADVAVLQYTSGSIAEPKGVMVTHACLAANLDALRHELCAGHAVEGVMWVPPYHDMGLVGGLFLTLWNGHHVTLMSPARFLRRPLSWLETIARNRATHTAVPNFALDLAVDRSTPEQRAAMDLSCVRMLLSGGEPVQPHSLERFAEAFAVSGFDPAALTPAYGLAESTLIATTVPVAQVPRRLVVDAGALRAGRLTAAPGGAPRVQHLVSCGRPVGGMQVAVVDPETQHPAAPGTVGEIWLAGSSLAGGYWQRPEETRASFGARLADGGDATFLRTGDLGVQYEGDLYVTGRIKDVIIVHGQNHYPQDIERTVVQADPVFAANAAAAFALPDAAGSDRLTVVAELHGRPADGLPALADRVRAAVGERYDLPLHRLVLIRKFTLPKTTSGKLRRQETRRLLSDGDLAVVHDWQAPMPTAPEPVAGSVHGTRAGNGADSPVDTGAAGAIAAVVAWLADQVSGLSGEPAAGLTPDRTLSQAGLSSVDIADLVQRAETRYRVTLPLDDAPRDMTLGDLARVIVDGGFERPNGAHAGAAPASTAAAPGPIDDPMAVLRARIAALAEAGLDNPFFPLHEATARNTTWIDGRELINFASYNYLALSGHPAVAEAAKGAIDRYGTSVSASRLVSGERPLHGELERALADLIGVDDAICLVSGNLTNVTVIGHLVGPDDLVLHDALAHDSIVQGARLSGATRRSFPHNDLDALERMLTSMAPRFARVLIAVEGIYSMDGDVADLARLVEIKRRHGAWLLVDEAHSIGTLGRTGRGLAEHCDVDARAVDAWMGTLSKAFASCGGYLAGSGELVQYLKYTAPGFVFSVGLPPASTAAALAAIRQLQAEPERVARLRERSQLFLDLARSAGLDTGLAEGTPVVPVILGDSNLAIAVSSALRQAGINVQPIIAPAVEEKAARLRFFVCADHTDAQIRTTVAATARVIAELTANWPPAEVAAQVAPVAGTPQ